MELMSCIICKKGSFCEVADPRLCDTFAEIIGVEFPGGSMCYLCRHQLFKLHRFRQLCKERCLNQQTQLHACRYSGLGSDKNAINIVRTNTLELTICSCYECFEKSSYNDTIKYSVIHELKNYVGQIVSMHTHTWEQSDGDYRLNASIHLDYESDREILHDYVNSDLEFTNGYKEINHSAEFDEYENPFTSFQSEDRNTGQFDSEHTTQSEFDVAGQFDNELSSVQSKNYVTGNELTSTVSENEETVPFDNKISTESDNQEIGHPVDEEGDDIAYDDTGNEPRFEKIMLTLEEQKAELDAMRKDKKYLEAKFRCYSCALGFVFKDSYKSHMVRHEESNGEYSCSVCTLRFAQSSVRSMHVALHAELYRCTWCSSVVKRARRRQHALRCGETTGAGCHECGEMFLDTIRLQQHIRRMHSKKANNKAYRCNMCNKTYKDSSTLRVHMIKHANERYNCLRCPSSFSTPYALNRHNREHDNKAQKYCAPCDAWFKSKKTYHAHLRTAAAHATNSYECTVCARACPTRQSLDTHMQTHAGVRHACTSCPAVYSTRKSLVRHVKTHAARQEGEKVICHLCGKGYKGKNKLRRHLREVCEIKNTNEYQVEEYTLEQLGLEN